MDSKNMRHTFETFFFSNPAKGHCVCLGNKIFKCFIRLEVRDKYELHHRKKLASSFEQMLHHTSKTRDLMRSLFRSNENEKEYFLHLNDW